MADGAPQIWDIPLTAAQRWALVQLAFDKAAPPVTDGAAGKKLRRALRAFGLMHIRDALKVSNEVSAATAAGAVPAMHKITAENLECVLGWSTIPRNTAIELEAGEVFDLLETIKAAPADYVAPAGAPFDPASEDWTPVKDPAPAGAITCPSCRQTFELGEAAAAPAAASGALS